MIKIDKKSIEVLAETHYMRFIAQYSLNNALKITTLIKKKLLEEKKRRKNVCKTNK